MTHPSPTAPLPPHLERAYEAKVFKAARPKGSHNAPHLNLACALADDVVALHNRLEAAEAQLSTRLPDRDGLDEIIRAWVKTLPFNVTEVLKQRHVTKLIDTLLSGAATPAPTAALTEEPRLGKIRGEVKWVGVPKGAEE